MNVLTLSTVLFTPVWFASFFGFDQGTTIKVSQLTVYIAIACGIPFAVGSIIDYLYNSREEYTRSSIALLKRAQPARWFVRLFATAALTAGWSAASTYQLLEAMVPYIYGTAHELHGIVTETRVTPGYFPCKENAVVVLEDGPPGKDRFCYRTGWLGRHVLAVGDVRVGSRVNILLNENMIGTAVSRIAVMNSEQ